MEIYNSIMLYLCVVWIPLFPYILCNLPPPNPRPIPLTNVQDLCKKGIRDEQILYRLGICYYHQTVLYNWMDAVQVCHSRNTHLVHVETEEEQDFIMQNTGDKSRHMRKEIWLGLKRTEEKNWVWFYNDKLYPVLNPRWSTTFPRSPRPHDVTQTYQRRTWAKINQDQGLEVVCEDPLLPELTNMFCDSHPSTTVSKWGPLSDFHCYYYIGIDSYTEGKKQCEMKSTHLIFLETRDEEAWIEKELRVERIPQKFWLGIEKNDTDQWNWSYRKFDYQEPNPRLNTVRPELTHAIFDTRSDSQEDGLKWERREVDRDEQVICEEDLYPKLISQLLCYRQNEATTGIFNPSNNHCYYTYPDEVPLSTAMTTCKDRGGYLATLEDAKEQRFVENEAYNYISGFSFWLSLRREEDGNWYWYGPGDSRTLVEEERWLTYVEAEDGGAAQAVSAEDGHWKQAGVVETYPFICEEEYYNDITIQLKNQMDSPPVFLYSSFLPELVIHYRACTKVLRNAIPLFNYQTRSCYYVFDNTTDWTTALQTCTRSKTYIVHPDTDKEQAWLVSLISDFSMYESIWIGIESRAADQWSWRFADYAEVTQTTRFTPEDNSGASNVKLMMDGTWERVAPESQSGLICEDSLSPLGLQEAGEVNIGHIVYVTHDTTEYDESTTSMETGGTTIEDTDEDLATATIEPETTTDGIAETGLSTTDETTPRITTEDAVNLDITTQSTEGPTGPTTDDTSIPENPETTSEEMSSPGSVPEGTTDQNRTPDAPVNPETLPEDKAGDAERSPISSFDVTQSVDATPGLETDQDGLRSSSISTNILHSMATPSIDTVQVLLPTSEISPSIDSIDLTEPTPTPTSTPYPTTSSIQSTVGAWVDELCPNADFFTGGNVIETAYKKKTVGKYENISKITFVLRASNLRCAKQCSLNPDCWFYTRDEHKTCTLYQYLYGSTGFIECGKDVSCYFKSCRSFSGAS